MRKHLRFTALLLTMLLLCAPLASAEVRRGDSGDEVYSLQLMLFESGWLFELPDGQFGRNTEQAVKDYEKYAGLPVDGIADDAMMASLEQDWYRLMLELGQIDENDGGLALGEGDFGNDGLAADGAFPAFCNHWAMSDSSGVTDYCEAHARLFQQALQLMENGTAESAQQACNLWRAEIIRQYSQWLDIALESDRNQIIAARTLTLSAFEAQLLAVNQWYDTFQVQPEDSEAYWALEIQMREHATWLCALLSGALAANESGAEY